MVIAKDSTIFNYSEHGVGTCNMQLSIKFGNMKNIFARAAERMGSSKIESIYG